jgi:hypothetical protein
MERLNDAPQRGRPATYLRRRFASAATPWFVQQPNWRFTVLLAADVLFVFAVMPLLSGHHLPRIIAPSLALLVTAGTIALVSDRRTVRFGVLAVLLLAGGSYVLPGRLSLPTTSTLQAACGVAILISVGRAVFARGVVDAHRIAGAVALYLNVGLAFAATYMLLSDLSPEAFAGLTPDRTARFDDMTHFSLTTLTTLGYGDILPRSALARSLADLEALIGQLFPATLLARLVGLEIGRR